MDSAEGSLERGHARSKSATKASRPRSSTKGPLDIGDSQTLPVSPQQAQQAIRLAPVLTRSRQPSPRGSAEGTRPVVQTASSRISPRKDFSFLLRPEVYHPLTPLSVPAPFRNSSRQPPSDAPLQDLLTRGHFRAAAIAAVHSLTGANGSPTPEPTDYARIFDLLYTRLACLTLIDATQVAAQEVKVLEDLNSAFYVDEISGAHLVPWELRVLNVRLQSMGFGDPRRAVMSYYDLAREARARIADATAIHDNSARELWRNRLSELGVNVAGALIEMDDLAGAAQHLSTLKVRGDEVLTTSKALLWLHLGDVEAARACVADGTRQGEIVAALCSMADGEHEAALSAWQDIDEGSDDEMVVVNTAVCLLYTGKMDKARNLLEGLIDRGYSSHTLLFNLSTMYELCSDRSRNMKLKLAEKVADMEQTPKGWEKGNADFKL